MTTADAPPPPSEVVDALVRALCKAVAFCPVCEGEGTVADGLDEAACSMPCPPCFGTGFDPAPLATALAQYRAGVADGGDGVEALAARLCGYEEAKREFKNEFGRQISTGVEIGAGEESYCRLYLYGPDSGIDSYCTRLELATMFVVLREVFDETAIRARSPQAPAAGGGS